MASVKKNGVITIAGQASLFITSLLITILLARILGPTARGEYAILTLIPFIILRISSLGLEESNTYFTANKQFAHKDIAANSLVMAIIISVVVVLICFGLFSTGFFQNFLSHINVSVHYFELILIAVPLILLQNFFVNILLGKSDFVKYNLAVVSQGIVQLIAIVILVLLATHSLSAAVYSYLLAIGTAAILSMILVYTTTEFKFVLSKNYLKKSTSYGSRLYIANITQYLNYRLDMIFAAMLLTTTSVGYYAIATGVVERLWMIPGALGIVLFPKVSNSAHDESTAKLTSRVTRNSLTIIIILAILLAIACEPLISILFGARFLPAVQPLLILLPGVIMLSVSKVLVGDLAGRGRPEFAMGSSIAGMLVSVPLYIYLIPKWGINGAAFASSVSYSVSTIVVMVAFSRLTNTRFSDFLLFTLDDLPIYMNILNGAKRVFKQNYLRLISYFQGV
ncbi:MAG TPA: oligosaccharide flippase family protein [Candidatus Aquicultor sp.]